MSEGGVGLVEREALDAARAEQTAAHQAYYRRLERIAHLDRLGLAHLTGDRSTARLLQENWRVDPATAGRWCDEAEDLAPRMTLQASHSRPGCRAPPRCWPRGRSPRSMWRSFAAP
jgi:hypothetical protein